MVTSTLPAAEMRDSLPMPAVTAVPSGIAVTAVGTNSSSVSRTSSPVGE